MPHRLLACRYAVFARCLFHNLMRELPEDKRGLLLGSGHASGIGEWKRMAAQFQRGILHSPRKSVFVQQREASPELTSPDARIPRRQATKQHGAEYELGQASLKVGH